MQPRLDGAERAAEQRGDLVQRCAGEESQFEYRAVLVRQGGQGRLHEPGIFRLLGGGRRFGLAGRPSGRRLVASDRRSRLAAALEKPMPQNSVQPG